MDRRMVSQISACMDEIVEKKVPCMILGVTSYLDRIDSGLRRAGRFDREIGMGIPSLKNRELILSCLTKGMKILQTEKKEVLDLKLT